MSSLTTLLCFFSRGSLCLSPSSVSVASLFYPVYVTVSPLSSLLQTMAEYSSLLSDLSENITNEDLEQLKSACKEDIPEDQSNNITSSKEWFSYLEKNDKLAQGEASDRQVSPPVAV